jgi:hypothetical protein
MTDKKENLQRLVTHWTKGEIATRVNKVLGKASVRLGRNTNNQTSTEIIAPEGETKTTSK